MLRWPAWEIAYWEAYQRVRGPVGEKRADYRAAQLEHAIVTALNAHAGVEDAPPPVEEFLLSFTREGSDAPRVQPVDQQIAATRAAEAARKAVEKG